MNNQNLWGVLILIVSIIIALSIIIFGVVIICKYLKKCQKLNYTPFNWNIIIATIPVPLAMWGTSILLWVSSKSFNCDRALKYILYYVCGAMLLTAIACIIINIKKTYKYSRTLTFSIFNYFVQMLMGLVTAFTAGLVLFLWIALNKAMMDEVDR